VRLRTEPLVDAQTARFLHGIIGLQLRASLGDEQPLASVLRTSGRSGSGPVAFPHRASAGELTQAISRTLAGFSTLQPTFDRRHHAQEDSAEASGFYGRSQTRIAGISIFGHELLWGRHVYRNCPRQKTG